MRFGDRLCGWRTRRGLSRAQLARAAEITGTALANYERGRRDVSVPVFLRLLGALEVTTAQLLDSPEILVHRHSALGVLVESLISEQRDRQDETVSLFEMGVPMRPPKEAPAPSGGASINDPDEPMRGGVLRTRQSRSMYEQRPLVGAQTGGG